LISNISSKYHLEKRKNFYKSEKDRESGNEREIVTYFLKIFHTFYR
jgi:hypothetical protein